MGVVQSPGSGKRMLDEMAPLLSAEGIDLDDLGDADLDEVNAALARATERHSLALFTPVGAAVLAMACFAAMNGLLEEAFVRRRAVGGNGASNVGGR